MDVTAITNQKGGVGKTATAKNLGAALAEMRRRTLMVDFDPQGNLTKALGVPLAPPGANLAAALLGTYTGDLGDLVVEISPDLYLLPASVEMIGIESQLYAKTGREMLLSRLLDAFAPAFDDCLIDCPPSLGVLTDAAVYAARKRDGRRGRIVIPVWAEDSSLDGLRLLTDQIGDIEEMFGVEIHVAGLVVNAYDGRKGIIVTSVKEAYDNHPLPVLAVIGDRKEIREGWRKKIPVVTHAPESTAAGWFRDLAAVLVKGGTS